MPILWKGNGFPKSYKTTLSLKQGAHSEQQQQRQRQQQRGPTRFTPRLGGGTNLKPYKISLRYGGGALKGFTRTSLSKATKRRKVAKHGKLQLGHKAWDLSARLK